MKRLATRPVIFTVFAILLIILFALTYVQWQPSTSSPEIEELPELFVKAAYGLNYSTKLLEISLTGSISDPSEHYSSMLSLSAKLRNLSEEGILTYSRLGRELRDSARAYSAIALAASKLDTLSMEIANTVPLIDAMFHNLIQCNISAAASTAEKLEPKLRTLKQATDAALKALAGVDADKLLSDQHRAIYSEAAEEAAKIGHMLVEISKIVNMLRNVDADTLRAACIAHKMGNTISLTNCKMLSQHLLAINPSKGCKYGYELGLIKSWLKALGQQSQNGQTGSETGGGAGAGQPSSDD